MLLYRIIKPFAHIALRTFYRKIYITGPENYPQDKPVILALNHPTAFVEPCILATLLDDELHFLVRGDFFQNPTYNKILRSFGCLPVYRLKDGGFQNIKNNYSTFDQTFKTLGEGNPIVILAEGTTVHEKRLRPLKKGTARLALGTMEEFGPEKDVHILPIGVNYTYADRFRSEVMFEVDRAIRVADYWADYQANKASAIKDLTDELTKRLEAKVIIIEKEEDETFTEQQFILSRNAKPRPIMPIVSKRGGRFKTEKRISETINRMSDSEKTVLKEKTEEYFSNLAQAGITDLGLLRSARTGLGTLFALVLGFVPFLFGWFLNAPPLLAAEYIGVNKVKYIEFKAPVVISAGIVFYFLWWVLLLTLSGFTANMPVFVLTLLLPGLGYFALLYNEFRAIKRQAQKATGLSEEKRAELLSMRRKIII